MLQSTALAQLRYLVNESSAGFWTDAQLYSYLDSAMNLVIDTALAKMETERLQNKYQGSILLQPLHTLDTSNTTVAGTQEYSLPSDFLVTDFCDYTPDDRVNGVLPSVLVDYNKMRFMNTNTYLVYTANNPAYYIRGAKIGFFPVPVTGGAGANRYNHYYYKRPATIASGTAGNEIPLKLEAHEPIILLGFHYALLQDSRDNEAQAQYNKAMDIIKNLR